MRITALVGLDIFHLAKKKPPLKAFLTAIAFTLVVVFPFYTTPLLQANPSGGTVKAGNATIGASTTGSTLTINQSSSKAIINWASFSINSGQTTNFLDPNSSSATLNLVTGNTSSAIDGTLHSNGQVFLLNPNGILVGPNGVVNTAGFVASTLPVTNTNDFLHGKSLHFLGNNGASVVNQGKINALGGDIYLIGNTVTNSGTLNATGTAGLAAGSNVLLTQAGTEHVFVAADTTSNSSTVKTGAQLTNSGNIQAAAAELKASGGNMYALAINNSGVVRASGAKKEQGRVFLTGGSGTVQVAGSFTAQHGKRGGQIEVTGHSVHLTNTARLAANGRNHGGKIFVGGGRRGRDASITNATTTNIDSGASITADATTKGNGGNVVVWSNEDTTFSGSISARGGMFSGNGGQAEVSGGVLNYTGFTNLHAARGNTGSLLLDPIGLTITGSTSSGDLTENMTNTFDGTSPNSTLAASTLGTALNGSNVVVQTEAGDIDVGGQISWNQNHSLTLNASGSVVFEKGSAVMGPSGATLTLVNAGNRTDYSLIENANDLQNINNNLGGTYALGQNIDLSGLSNFTGLGTFNGIFNGLNNTLSNLTINTPNTDNVGLFNQLSFGAIVQNLNLSNVNVSGLNYVGAVAGAIQSNFSVNITNVNVLSGTVKGGENYVGGLVGGMPAGHSAIEFGRGPNSISFSSNAASVTGGYAASGQVGYEFVGGLVGDTYVTNITASSNSGTVTDPGLGGSVGGLVGELDSLSSITTSSNTGSVSLFQGSSVGGLVGLVDNSSSVTTSSNTGNVSMGSGFYFGGVVGYNAGTLDQVFTSGKISSGDLSAGGGGLVGFNSGTITNASSMSSLTSSDGTGSNLGGFVGVNSGTISNSFSTGAITNTNPNSGDGAFASSNTGTVTNSYWDTQTSGSTSDTSGAIGKTTAFLQSSAFLTSLNGSPSSGNWGIFAGSTYPYLTFQFQGTTPVLITGTTSGGLTASSVVGVVGTTGVTPTYANDATGYFYLLLPPSEAPANSLFYFTAGNSSTNGNVGSISNTQAASNVLLKPNTTTLGGGGTSGAPINGGGGGVTAIEYDAITGLITTAISTAVGGLATNLKTSFTTIGNNLNGTTGTGTTGTGTTTGNTLAEDLNNRFELTANTLLNVTDPNIVTSGSGSINLDPGSTIDITDANGTLVLTSNNAVSLGATVTQPNSSAITINAPTLNLGSTGTNNPVNDYTLTNPQNSFSTLTANNVGNVITTTNQDLSVGSVTANSLTTSSTGNITVAAGATVQTTDNTTLTAGGNVAVNGTLTSNAGGTINLAAGAGASSGGGSNATISGISPTTVTGDVSQLNVIAPNPTTYNAGSIPVVVYTEVYNAQDLSAIGNNLSGNYALGAGFSVGNFAGIGAPVGGGQPQAFTGIFNGENYTLSNLTINTPDAAYVGLFSELNGATVENLNLTNVNITGNNYVGALAGSVAGSTINSVTVNGGQITGFDPAPGNSQELEPSYYVGGLAGSTDHSSSVSFSSVSNATVKGNNNVGGLIGQSLGTISHSFTSDTTVTGIDAFTTVIGGLVGSNFGSISDSFSTLDNGTTNVNTASGPNGSPRNPTTIGGLVGYNGGTLSYVYSTLPVSSQSTNSQEIGGLAGENGGTIQYAYSAGNVIVGSGSTDVGGLVGYNNGGSTVSNSYYAPTTNSAIIMATDGTAIGGLVGDNGGTIENSFSSATLMGPGGSQEGRFVGLNETYGLLNNPTADDTASKNPNGYNFIGQNSGTISTTGDFSIGDQSTSTLQGSAGTALLNSGSGGTPFTTISGLNSGFQALSDLVLTVTPSTDPQLVYGTSNAAATQDLTATYTYGVNGTAQTFSTAPLDFVLGSSALNVGTYNTATYLSDPFFYSTVETAGADTTFTVSPDPITLSATGSQTYGGASLAESINATPVSGSFVGTDAVSTLGLTNVVFTPTATASSHVAGNPYSIGLSATNNDANYAVSYTAGTFTVNADPITLSATGSQTYGGANLAESINALPANGSFVGTEGVTTLGLTNVAFTPTATASSHVAGNPYSIGLSATNNDSDYAVSYTAGTFTVNADPITLNATGSQSYGGANLAESINALPANGSFVGTEGVTTLGLTNVAFTPTATASSHVAGNPYSIGLSATNHDSDYAVSYTAGTFTVNADPITLSATGSQTYGGANLAESINALPANGSFVGTEGVTTLGLTNVAFTPTATASSHVAGNPYSIGLSATNHDTDYSVSYTPGTFTVNADPITLSATGSQSYGGANLAESINALPANGSFVGTEGVTTLGLTNVAFTPTATASSHVAGNPYSIGLSATNNDSDYAVSYTAGTFTVNADPITLSATGSQTYGGANLAESINALPANGSFVGTEGVTTLGLTNVAFTPTATASSHVAGNPYSIGLSATNNDSDYAVSYTDGTFTVNADPITLSATGSQTYGGANLAESINALPANGSFVGTEGVTTLGLTNVAFTPTATASSHVAGNPYSIGLSATNNDSDYAVSYTDGTFTVNADPITLSATGSQTYGGANLAESINALPANGSFVGTEGVTTLGLTNVAFTPTATASSHVAGNPYSIGLSATNHDTDYSVSYTPGTFTVNADPITLSATGSQTYGGANLAESINALPANGSFVGTEGVTTLGLTNVAFTPTATASSHVAGNPYSIGLSATNNDSDYAVSYTAGTFTVNADPITLSATGSQTYGGANLAESINALPANGSFVGTEGVTTLGLTNVAFTPTATASSHVAGNPYSIGLSATNNDSDYAVSYTDGTFTVNADPITLSATGSQTYGGANLAESINALPANGSFVGTEGVTTLGLTNVAFTPTATASSHVAGNPYSIGLSATNNDSDYAVSYTDGTFTVNADPITLSATGSQTYGGANLAESINALPANGSFVGTEGVTTLGLTNVAFTPTATASSHVAGNPYSIGLSATNNDSDYAVSYTDGTFTVNADPITLNATGSQTYGGANLAESINALPANGSFVGTEGVTTLGLTNVAFTPTATASSHVAGNPYSIGLSATNNDSDYAVSYTDGTFTVNADPITLSATGSQTYGGANLAESINALPANGSFVGTEGVTTLGLTNVAFTPTATASSHVAGNPYSIGLSATNNDSDYAVSYTDGTFTVNADPITLSATGSQTYGGANLAESINALPANGSFVGTEGVTTLGLTNVAFTPTATASSHVAGNPYSIGLSATNNDSDYAVSYTAGTFTVNADPITLNATGSQTYGGANLAESINALPANGSFVGTEGVTTLGLTNVVFTPTATASSHVAGNPYSIGLSATNNDSDYAVSYTDGTFTVNADPITLSATGSQTYGGANLAESINALPANGSFVGTEGVTTLGLTNVAFTPTATASSHVAGNPYSIGLSAANNDLDYAVSYTAGTFTVNADPITLSATGSQTYGGANLAESINALPANGSFVGTEGVTTLGLTNVAFTPTATASSHVAGNPYSIGLSATNHDSDYAVSYTAGTFTVNADPITLNSTGSQTYGGANLAESINATPANGSFVGAEGVNTLGLTNVVFTPTATASSHVTGNPYSIGLSATNNDSDYAVSFSPGIFTVNPAALTVTPNGTWIYGYGSSTFTPQFIYSTLVAGNTPSVLGTPNIVFAPNLTSTTSVGTYGPLINGGAAISASGLSDSDYTISYKPGTLQITQEPIFYTAFATSMTYGQGVPGLNGDLTTLTGQVVNNNTFPNLTKGGPHFATTMTVNQNSNVGIYGITGSGVTLNPSDPLSSNYILEQNPNNSFALTINPAQLKITPNNATWTYGETGFTVQLNEGGFVDGQNASVVTGTPVYSFSGVSTFSNVGNYNNAVNVTGLSAPNYTIVYMPGNLNIKPAPLTIYANSQFRLVGQPNPTFTDTVIGALNGFVPTVMYSTNSQQNSQVGLYNINVNAQGNPNYQITTINGGLLVLAAATAAQQMQDSSYTATQMDEIIAYAAVINNPQFNQALFQDFADGSNGSGYVTTQPSSSVMNDITAALAADLP